jgi:ubiquinone/menaquinone biosynthesis C-methylase UbiE
LAGQGFHVWGADFAPQGVKYAQQWAVDEGLDITFVCAPITDYAFPGRQFDAVVAALVLDLVSTEEFETAVEVFGTALGSTGHLFAVFNPSEKPAEAVENPTAGVTLIQYSDSEIEEIVAKAGYYLVRRKVLDQDTRGFLWRRDPSSA